MSKMRVEMVKDKDSCYEPVFCTVLWWYLDHAKSQRRYVLRSNIQGLVLSGVHSRATSQVAFNLGECLNLSEWTKSNGISE